MDAGCDVTDPGRHRRGPRAFQPIEPVEPSNPPGPTPEPTARAQPSWFGTPGGGRDPIPARPAGAEPSAAPADGGRNTAPLVPFAARFRSAASALVFAGQLLSIGSAEDLTFRAGPDRSWWVLARLALDIAREFTAATRGEAYVEAAPGRLVPDRGWGGPPSAAGEDQETANSADLTVVGIRDMVRVSGLHAAPVRPLTEVSVLLPGRLTADIVRRALDLRLDVAHRAVRLRPLFNGTPAAAPPDARAVVELRVSASRGQVPGGLLLALSRDARMTVCRRTGQNGNLLIQYGMAPALLDHLLAGLVRAESWLLSRGSLGCRSVETVDGFIDSTSLLRLADSFPLHSQEPVADDPVPQLPQLRVVRTRTTGRDVDALLLGTDDLGTVSLLLEGHPLAESAHLVRGRDRHLLLAPGGLLESLPIGEALYCWGPGPLYLPVGFATRPQLPPSARRALFDAGERTAVVLLPNLRVHFDLTTRVPVWTLWTGPPPPVEAALPTEALVELADGMGPTPAGQGLDGAGSASEQRPSEGDRRKRGVQHAGRMRTGTWLDDALEAELAGRLVRAAELHERHGDPVRAAHLFERAAREGAGTDSP